MYISWQIKDAFHAAYGVTWKPIGEFGNILFIMYLTIKL